ncbi:hypothetical protein [Lysobacter arvi]|uniref:Secreted protein n=1 Tax=Lysobacter arvi TaxID=3038776 RepID=A0ABU1CGX1_9GAMM|nr:hypothetical protein [Lysobacter arvi]MDR0184198.1 hypothetical protein [Lysobacter arvi]
MNRKMSRIHVLLFLLGVAMAMPGCDRRETDGNSTTPPTSGDASEPVQAEQSTAPAPEANSNDSTAPGASNPPPEGAPAQSTSPAPPEQDDQSRR